MSYDLDAASGGGISEQGVGIGSGSGIVERDHACVVCGYNLRGIAQSGVCPECGSAVERSFRGDELIYSSREFVETLHKGVVLVLAGVIASILIGFAGFGLNLAGAMIGAIVRDLPKLISAASLLATAVTAFGWWLLSEPDPASREGRRGEKARRVVRVCTIVGVALQVVSFGLVFFLPAPATVMPAPGGPPPPPLSLATMMASILVGVVGTVAGVIAYFAQMYYIRWLAPRLPSARVFDRAKLLMWLGPVLYTVGALCLMLGPLVALVMYWNMLDWVRKDLKRIRAEMAGIAAA